MYCIRRIAFLALICVAICQAVWAKSPAFSVQGEVEFRGKRYDLNSGYARWRPKKNKLFIQLYPIRMTPSESKKALEDKSFANLDKVEENGNERWDKAPMVWITITFKKGKPRSLSADSMEKATISFHNFDKKGSSSTISGDAFKLHKDFKAFKLESPDTGKSAEFHLKSEDMKTHKYRIEAKGVLQLLAPFNY